MGGWYHRDSLYVATYKLPTNPDPNPCRVRDKNMLEPIHATQLGGLESKLKSTKWRSALTSLTVPHYNLLSLLNTAAKSEAPPLTKFQYYRSYTQTKYRVY